MCQLISGYEFCWVTFTYLIDPLVGDDGEGRGVVEDVVVAVLLPEGEVDVAEAVVEELVKVRPRPDRRPRQQVLADALW